MEKNRITPQLLMKVSRYITFERANTYAPLLDSYTKKFELDHCISRLAMFLAQIIHESCYLRYTEEIASGEAYERRTDIGNTPIDDGDGPRYKGRGLLQITGRHNYQEMAAILDIDLINHPELLSEPEYAVASACQWWNKRRIKLNRYADIGDVMAVTKIINGGLNGIVERTKLYTNIQNILMEWLS